MELKLTATADDLVTAIINLLQASSKISHERAKQAAEEQVEILNSGKNQNLLLPETTIAVRETGYEIPGTGAQKELDAARSHLGATQDRVPAGGWGKKEMAVLGVTSSTRRSRYGSGV